MALWPSARNGHLDQLQDIAAIAVCAWLLFIISCRHTIVLWFHGTPPLPQASEALSNVFPIPRFRIQSTCTSRTLVCSRRQRLPKEERDRISIVPIACRACMALRDEEAVVCLSYLPARAAGDGQAPQGCPTASTPFAQGHRGNSGVVACAAWRAVLGVPNGEVTANALLKVEPGMPGVGCAAVRPRRRSARFPSPRPACAITLVAGDSR